MAQGRCSRNPDKEHVDIVIGIPRYTAGVVFFTFENLVPKVQIAAQAAGYSSVKYSSSGPNLPQNRNNCVAEAQERGAKWLFFMDTDTLPPVDVLPQLIKHDVDIVSGTYYGKTSPYVPIASKVRDDGLFENIFLKQSDLGVLRSDMGGVGGGCLLVKTKVFDKIPFPWFEIAPASIYRDYDKLYSAAQRVIKSGKVGDLNAALQSIKKPKHDRENIGEDYFFCCRAADAGFKIHLDTSVQCGHLGWHQYSFVDHLAAQQQMDAKRDMIVPTKEQHDDA